MRAIIASLFVLVLSACDGCGGFARGQPKENGSGADGGSTTNNNADPDGGVSSGPGPFCLASVFFAGGQASEITARFSRDAEKTAAGSIANYELRGSDGTTVSLSSAAVSGTTVTLGLGGKLNASLKSYTVTVSGITAADNGAALDPLTADCTHRTLRRPIYLNILWHQHQPLYLDAVKDELQGPWVRKHSTKDYFTMASILTAYPTIHLNVNLTSVLLSQLQIYLDRLGPFVDIKNGTVDAAGFEAKWAGHTDPWIDQLLTPTPDPANATARQIELFWNAPWSSLSTSDALMKHFPAYMDLRRKPPTTYTQDDFLQLKGWFEIAWFDPEFLHAGGLTMPDGNKVDLSDLLDIKKDSVGDPNFETFSLKTTSLTPGGRVTEALCNRLVAENYKVMKNVVAIHKQLRFDPQTRSGQIEIITTPFYHPILPLLISSDAAKESQQDPLPAPAFSYPDDASAQVAKAVRYYRDIFGAAPSGMWPGEGSVSQAAVQVFHQNGIRWIATGQENIEQSTGNKPPGVPPFLVPYRALPPPGVDAGQSVTALFRARDLSDEIGFRFQGETPEQGVTDFLSGYEDNGHHAGILDYAPGIADDDRLLTVILDGENAWENYVHSHDAKEFKRKLYQRLTDEQGIGEIITTTTSEYLDGNPTRNIPPHDPAKLRQLDHLHAGSWIRGTFDIWIGAPTSDQAWTCLKRVRDDVAAVLPRPNPAEPPPLAPAQGGDAFAWNNYKAWEEMYAAEGSDWFWWLGGKEITPAHDNTPFDRGFRAHLAGVYNFMNLARAANGDAAWPTFQCPVILQASGKQPAGPFTTAPTIEGTFETTEAEWVNEGGFFNDIDSSQIDDPTDQIKKVYYGYTVAAPKATPPDMTPVDLYLAEEAGIDLVARAKADAGHGQQLTVTWYVSQKNVTDANAGTFTRRPSLSSFATTTEYGTPIQFQDSAGAARAIRCKFDGSGKVAGSIDVWNGTAWTQESTNVTAAAQGNHLELKVPFIALKLAKGDPLEFAVASQEGADIDIAPKQQLPRTMLSQTIFDDPTNAIFVTFSVDASGKSVPLGQFGSCCTNAPKPTGSGVVYLAGNTTALGLKGKDWTPNLVAMTQRTDNPSIWEFTTALQKGMALNYKYTVGVPSDEASWPGTEEFPVTYRGFVVGTTDKTGVKRFVVHDVFADKPCPPGQDGNPGCKTTFSAAQ